MQNIVFHLQDLYIQAFIVFARFCSEMRDSINMLQLTSLCIVQDMRVSQMVNDLGSNGLGMNGDAVYSIWTSLHEHCGYLCPCSSN